MLQQIRSFGGETRSHFSIVDGEETSLTLRRVVWFDRDIDGHWLVWASDDAGTSPPLTTERSAEVGAIIVRDPVVIAFIEQFADLVAHPGRFADEPTLGV